MTNWSVILNVLLLAGVVFAIARMAKAKRQVSVSKRFQARAHVDVGRDDDAIIAVRKLEPVVRVSDAELVSEVETKQPQQQHASEAVESVSLVLFLLAKGKRQLAGYELLQTMLAAGLRFGEGQLFHRHQFANGQGPIICSLATATKDGTFDLQNMGAFSVHGLCLFMETSGNSSIDVERFSIMLDTAKQLSEGLDTYLLDDARKPWSEVSLARYHQLLGVTFEEEVAV
jgi:cell division protein ZipA